MDEESACCPQKHLLSSLSHPLQHAFGLRPWLRRCGGSQLSFHWPIRKKTHRIFKITGSYNVSLACWICVYHLTNLLFCLLEARSQSGVLLPSCSLLKKKKTKKHFLWHLVFVTFSPLPLLIPHQPSNPLPSTARPGSFFFPSIPRPHPAVLFALRCWLRYCTTFPLHAKYFKLQNTLLKILNESQPTSQLFISSAKWFTRGRGGGGGCIEEMQKKNIGISNLRTQNSSRMRRSYDMFRSKTDSPASRWDPCDVVTLEEGAGGGGFQLTPERY